VSPSEPTPTPTPQYEKGAAANDEFDPYTSSFAEEFKFN
jgi:hypothetical protein